MLAVEGRLERRRKKLDSRIAEQAAAGRRRSAPPWACVFICLVWMLAAAPVQANGGKVQIGNQMAGPYQITVFTDPTPIRVGVVDVSVAVQKAGSTEMVQDARVTVTTEPLGRSGAGGVYVATHERATNKLFYAADVEVPAAGRYAVTVDVRSGLGEGSVSFEMEVEEASPFDNAALLLVAALPLLLLLAWWLRGARRAMRG